MNYVNFNRQKGLAFTTSVDANPNTVYFTSDTHEIIINGLSYGPDLLPLLNKIEEVELVTSAALNHLNAVKQNKTDNNLKTNDKSVVGAINELNTKFNEIEQGLDDGEYLPLSGGTVTGNFGVSNLFTVSTLGDDIPIILGDQSNKAVRIAYNTLYDSELDIINNPHLIIGPSDSAALFLNRSGVQAVHTDNAIVSTLHLNPQGGLVKCGGGIETSQNITTASINLLGTTSNVLKYTDINLLLYDLINSHICLGENIENSITDTITLSANNVNVYKNMSVGGDINAAAFYETSDARKKDIKSDLSLDKCYDLIDKCQTVIYSLKDQTKEQVGMIAQEIEEFFPEVISTDEEGFKSLAYDRLVVICFRVLKDIIKRLEKLENV